MDEQSTMTLKRAEHCGDLQRVQVPVIFVLQSVAFSSNRQRQLPPLEMLAQGLSEPGKLATAQPAGIGI